MLLASDNHLHVLYTSLSILEASPCNAKKNTDRVKHQQQNVRPSIEAQSHALVAALWHFRWWLAESSASSQRQPDSSLLSGACASSPRASRCLREPPCRPCHISCARTDRPLLCEPASSTRNPRYSQPSPVKVLYEHRDRPRLRPLTAQPTHSLPSTRLVSATPPPPPSPALTTEPTRRPIHRSA